MTQTPPTVLPAPRPQLFAPASSSSRPVDFGPSILATIDGGGARNSVPGEEIRSRHPLWWGLGLAAALCAAGYLTSQYFFEGDSPSRAADIAMAPGTEAARPLDSGSMAAKDVELKASSPLSSPVAASASSGGGAVIETMPEPSMAFASDAQSAVLVAGEVLPRGEAASGAAAPHPLPAQTRRSETPKAVPRISTARQLPAQNKGSPVLAAQPAGSSPDTDADLLAAMLPHLAQFQVHPQGASSPAFEKRCGRLSGEAVVECRAKFCNGREGVDAACPANDDKVKSSR